MPPPVRITPEINRFISRRNRMIKMLLPSIRQIKRAKSQGSVKTSFVCKSRNMATIVNGIAKKVFSWLRPRSTNLLFPSVIRILEWHPLKNAYHPLFLSYNKHLNS